MVRANVKSSVLTVSVDVDLDWTIARVKEEVAKAMDPPVQPSRIRLIFMGRVLKDEERLSTYRYEEGQTLHMVVRQPDMEPRAQSSSSGPARSTSPQPSAAQIPGLDIQGLLGNLMNIGVQFGSAMMSGNAPAQTGNQSGPTPPAQGSSDTRSRPQPRSQPTAVPATAQGRAGPAAASIPPVSGVQVHVHVTLEQLPQLPEKLRQFYAAMPQAPRVVVHQEEHVDSSGMASRFSTTLSMGQHGELSQQDSSVGSFIAGVTQAARAGEDAARPRQTIGQMARASGLNIEEEGDISTIFDCLSSEAFNMMDVSDVMRCASGDWAPMQKAQQPLAAFIQKATGGDTTAAAHRRLAVNTAHEAVQKISSHAPAFVAELHRRERNSANALRAIEIVLRHASLELIAATFSEPEVFPRRLRSLAVHRIGHLIEYANRELFTSGSTDTDAVIRVAIQEMMRNVGESNAQLGGLAQAVAPMLQGYIRMWHSEYRSNTQSPADDRIFDESDSTFEVEVEALQRANQRSPPSDDDDMLEEALDEAVNLRPPAKRTREQAAEQTPANPLESLRSALATADLDAEVSSRILHDAAQARSPPQQHPADGTGPHYDSFNRHEE